MSPEMFEKIQKLQEKHDLEIELLANELNLQPYFIKVKIKLNWLIKKTKDFMFLIKFIIYIECYERLSSTSN